jgi:hypothetical protein
MIGRGSRSQKKSSKCTKIVVFIVKSKSSKMVILELKIILITTESYF